MPYFQTNPCFNLAIQVRSVRLDVLQALLDLLPAYSPATEKSWAIHVPRDGSTTVTNEASGAQSETGLSKVVRVWALWALWGRVVKDSWPFWVARQCVIRSGLSRFWPCCFQTIQISRPGIQVISLQEVFYVVFSRFSKWKVPQLHGLMSYCCCIYRSSLSGIVRGGSCSMLQWQYIFLHWWTIRWASARRCCRLLAWSVDLWTFFCRLLRC